MLKVGARNVISRTHYDDSGIGVGGKLVFDASQAAKR